MPVIGPEYDPARVGALCAPTAMQQNKLSIMMIAAFLHMISPGLK